MITKKSKIFIAGHNGHLGSAILKIYQKLGYKNIITIEKKKLDLLNQKKVFEFLRKKKPNLVIIAAARVGGILANNLNKGSMIYENLQIQNNLIHGSYINNIRNIIFFGSSCIYPKNIRRKITENDLLSGKLEETNEPYALAKIAGIKLCQSYNFQYNTNYKCLMPCNLYGPNDNYDENSSHFLAAIIKKIFEAKIKNQKEVVIWGSGKPKRELLFVDDAAYACEYFSRLKTDETLINIGSGLDKTIFQYYKDVMKYFSLNLKFKFDRSKPDGTYRKLLYSNLAQKYGWRPKFNFLQGLELTIDDFIKKNI